MATHVMPITNLTLLKELGGFLHVDGDFRSFIQLSVVVAELKTQLQMMARDKSHLMKVCGCTSYMWNKGEKD